MALAREDMLTLCIKSASKHSVHLFFFCGGGGQCKSGAVAVGLGAEGQLW